MMSKLLTKDGITLEVTEAQASFYLLLGFKTVEPVEPVEVVEVVEAIEVPEPVMAEKPKRARGSSKE